MPPKRVRLIACLTLSSALLGALLLTLAGASSSFQDTMTNAPAAPMPYNGATWDVLVHSRDNNTWNSLEPMNALHGPDCSAPPATHQISAYDDAVFQCRDHLMTAINAGGYGLVALTPNVLADFSAGEAVIRWDISTHVSSFRDWWDVTISPFDQNLAYPLYAWLPDGAGMPLNALNLKFRPEWRSLCPVLVTNGSERDLDCDYMNSYDNYIQQSPTVRTTFEARISRNHLKVGIPSINLWWFDGPIPDLSFSQAVVQFAHHSYNPSKDCVDPPPGECIPNTWHWDNFSISPAVPFSIIKANTKRFTLDDGATTSVSFPQPAPDNAFLRFLAVAPNVQIDDGSGWRSVSPQPSSAPDPNRASSFFVPVPRGTSSVAFRLSKGSGWFPAPYLVNDITLWSRNSAD